jgi:hypothetical protein
MAQAESITTAIRELMSRGQPVKSTNRVRAAHTEFIAALAANTPRPTARSPIIGANIIAGRSHRFSFSAISTSRRSASDREGRSG